MIDINELVDSKIKEARKLEPKRSYLGASMLGDECLRKLQYMYQQREQDFIAQTLRTFDIGHNLEDLVAQWMRTAGFYLVTKNENGEQIGFSTAGGRIQGHVDGIIEKSPVEEIKTPCIWECKTLNDASWKDTKKRGVFISKPIYYAQVQLYMAYINQEDPIEATLFTALNKNTSELYFELIPFDPEIAQQTSDKAVKILNAEEHGEELPRVATDPNFFMCKMCNFYDLCWNTQK